MRVGLFLFYIFSSSATFAFISAISLDPEEYARADDEAPYESEALFSPDTSIDYQGFDPTTFMTSAGPDGGLFPEISQGQDATGAALLSIIGGAYRI